MHVAILLTTLKPSGLNVVKQFVQAGKQIHGFDCVLAGDIPRGSGISSSAAVEGGLAFALNELFDAGYNRKELALLCQRAEHDFPNVKCGIMDQFSSIMGLENKVIKIDCRTLDYTYHDADFSDYSLILFDSNVKHSLMTSAYNERRQQCEEGIAIVKANFPEINEGGTPGPGTVNCPV